MGRLVVAVSNRSAGLSRSGKSESDVMRAFARADSRSRLDLVRTRAPGEARELAQQAVKAGAAMVLSVGGDGTANEVANGLLGSSTALGVVPTGTMNLLARVLRIPLAPTAAAAHLALSRARRPVRPGVMNGRAFLLMGGTGFDAWVLRELLHHRRGKIGFGDYARGALRGLRRYPFPDLKVSSSGSESRGHTAIVGRAPLYGGFLRPTPRADLARDRFEVCTISEGVGTLIRTVAAMWSGDHLRCPGIDMSFHRSLLVESLGAKIPIQIDGELAGELPARFEISSRELQLVV